MQCQHYSGHEACKRSCQAHIGFPEAAEPCLPEQIFCPPGSRSFQLSQRIMHVEFLISENAVKDCPRKRIVIQHFAVLPEIARGRAFGEVDESEERSRVLIFDAKVV